MTIIKWRATIDLPIHYICNHASSHTRHISARSRLDVTIRSNRTSRSSH
jgi:hypothetical protein